MLASDLRKRVNVWTMVKMIVPIRAQSLRM